MSEPSITQPNATTYPIDDLVSAAREGRVRIPDFQRPLRWQWEDVRRLFDSIVRGYPIGSMLFWARPAPAATVRLGALHIEAPARPDALWVVDGQQRITSLANALSDEGAGDSRFALAYDLRARMFVRPGDEPQLLPLPVLFDLQRLLKWFAERPNTAALLDEATRVAKAIRQYTAPAYIVKQDDEAVLRDIFDRMNNYGRRLSRAEVFTALHAGQSSTGRPRSLGDIAEHLDTRFGFGLLDDDTVLRAFLARRGPDVTREIRLEFGGGRVSREFPNETADDANQAAEVALERAVRFLQDDAKIPHFAFLPYRYLLVVLTRFFAHHAQPAHRNRDLLRRWFWRAALVGPALGRGAYTNAMHTLASCIVATDEDTSVASLLAAVQRFPPSFTFPERFRSTMAECRFVLCAMWSLSPRSPLTAEPYEREALAAALAGRRTATDVLEMLFPRRGEHRNDTGNRVLLVGDDANGDARALFAERPSQHDAETWQGVLASHALTEDVTLLLSDEDGAEPIRRRALELSRATSAFLKRMTEQEFEDTPPLESLDLDDEQRDDDPEPSHAEQPHA